MILSDRFKAAVESFVSRLVGRYDYAATYAYTVVAQNADGTIDAKPDRTDLVPAVSNLQILYSHPGEKVTVSAGARCLVVFADRDPSKPRVLGWENSSINTLVIGDKNQQAVARQGDLVQCGGVGTVVTFTPVTPSPNPLAPGVPYLISFSSVAQPQAPLYGAVASGSLVAKCK